MQLMRSVGVSSFDNRASREFIPVLRVSFMSTAFGHRRMWSSVSGSSPVQWGKFSYFLFSISYCCCDSID
jgi:hypothetical protein